jgi:hypothetical protein
VVLIRSWRDAEQVASAWMRANGFPDAAATGEGADGGIDVISAAAVAQVKAHMNAVRRPEVQQLYGIAASDGRQPIFFSLAGYTADARVWADRVGMPLFSFDLQSQVTPTNAAAEHLVDRADNGAGTRPSGNQSPDPAAIIAQLPRHNREGALPAARRLVEHLLPIVDVVAVGHVDPLVTRLALIVADRRRIVLTEFAEDAEVWVHERERLTFVHASWTGTVTVEHRQGGYLIELTFRKLGGFRGSTGLQALLAEGRTKG